MTVILLGLGGVVEVADVDRLIGCVCKTTFGVGGEVDWRSAFSCWSWCPYRSLTSEMKAKNYLLNRTC
jgi:hypothetical protein